MAWGKVRLRAIVRLAEAPLPPHPHATPTPPSTTLASAKPSAGCQEQVHITALIVSEYSAESCHWNLKQSLSEWLTENKVRSLAPPGLQTHGPTHGPRLRPSTDSFHACAIARLSGTAQMAG